MKNILWPRQRGKRTCSPILSRGIEPQCPNQWDTDAPAKPMSYKKVNNNDEANKFRIKLQLYAIIRPQAKYSGRIVLLQMIFGNRPFLAIVFILCMLILVNKSSFLVPNSSCFISGLGMFQPKHREKSCNSILIGVITLRTSFTKFLIPKLTRELCNLLDDWLD